MKYILIIMAIFSFGFTQSTLCYKNNVQNIATLESEKFDGGECKGNNSIDDMKSKGWVVSDIKMQSNDDKINYIYVLKKDINNVKTNKALVVTDVANSAKTDKMLSDGKKFYQNKCVECHGKFGEIESSGTSRPIRDLSMDELFQTMRAYSMNEYDRGMAILMTPYASHTTEQELEDIYHYLQSVNNK